MKLYDNCIRAFVKGNLGDDLFIYTLCKRYPDQKFVICGEEKYKYLFNSISNLKYIAEDSFFRKWLFRAVKLPAWTANKICEKFKLNKCFRYYHSNTFVYEHSKNNILVSGSIFMELGEGFVMNPYYKGEIKYYAKHPYVIGCNFGPYRTKAYKAFYKKCFQNAAQVSFRDEYSYSLFKDLENTSFAPDILFNVDTEAVKTSKEKDYVLISVLNPCKDDTTGENKLVENYIEKMAEISDKLISAGKKILFMGFCEFQGDGEIIDRIIKKMKTIKKAKKAEDINSTTKNVKVVKYPEITTEEALGYIKNSEFVIATRYHAMILAEVFNRPVLPVVYNEKMVHVIEDITPSMEYISINECEKWNSDLIAENILNGSNIAYNIDETVKKAGKHFEKLDKL